MHNAAADQFFTIKFDERRDKLEEARIYCRRQRSVRSGARLSDDYAPDLYAKENVDG